MWYLTSSCSLERPWQETERLAAGGLVGEKAALVPPMSLAPSSRRAYCCEEVDQAAVTQAVHSLVAWGKDCEGPGPVQDGGQPTVLQGWEKGSGRLCGPHPPEPCLGTPTRNKR